MVADTAFSAAAMVAGERRSWSGLRSRSPADRRSAAWAVLSAALPQRDACRRMVDLLWLAHDEACETELAALIVEDLAANRLPEARALGPHLVPRRRSLPADTPVALTTLASFDALLEVRP